MRIVPAFEERLLGIGDWLGINGEAIKSTKIIINYVLKILQNDYPECINFLIDFPENGIFIGSTPERLIEKKRLRINTEAIAGTIKRGLNKKEDLIFNKSPNLIIGLSIRSAFTEDNERTFCTF